MVLPDGALWLSYRSERKWGYMKDLSSLEIKEYFRILWYRRWYFLIVFALVSIGGIIYARRQPDIYKSEARVAVDIPLSSVSRSSLSVKERKDLIREQLSSRSFLERMIQQTGSYGFGDSRDFVMQRALDNVRKNIVIDNTSERTFKIAFRATDPDVARRTTQQFTQELIHVSKRSVQDRVNTLDRFVEEQFVEAENKLKEQSEKIRQFKQMNAGKLPEQSSSNSAALAGRLSQLNTVEYAIQQAKNNKDLLDDQYDWTKQQRAQIEQIRSSSAGANPVISSISSPEERDLAQKLATLARYEEELAQFLDKYTEKHPDVTTRRQNISRLEQEVEEARAKLKPSSVVNTDPDVAATPLLTMADIDDAKLERGYTLRSNLREAEIAKLEQERVKLLKEIADYESRLKIAPTLEQDLEDLLREEERLKKQYDTYSAQKLTTGLATAVETDRDNEVYRVIDEASYPQFPEWPNRVQQILIGFGIGLVAGIAAAFGRELIDTTISSEEEAKKIFNIPVLAAIPVAPKRKKKTELRKTA